MLRGILNIIPSKAHGTLRLKHSDGLVFYQGRTGKTLAWLDALAGIAQAVKSV